MAFTVSVNDTSSPRWTIPSSAYLPTVHHFHLPHPDPTIQLVDLVESWKNLSPSHAAELRFWHNALRTSLEKYIHDTVVGNLRDNGINADAYAVHEYVSSLGHQTVHVEIDRVIEDAIKQQKKASSPVEWFARDKRVALVNLLRTWHCFMDDQPMVHLFFYSEIESQGGLQVFVEVANRPHVFYVDQQNGGFVFKSPVLDGGKGLYEIVVGDVKRAGELWEVKVVTKFKEARFERLYRFRNEVKPTQPPPGFGHASTTKTKATKKKVNKSSSRKKLREISQNSVRVQGMSDFEVAARESHPQLYQAHHDHVLGKTNVLGKLYGCGRGKQPSPVRPLASMVNLREDWEDFRSHVGGVHPQPPPSELLARLVGSAERPRIIEESSDDLPGARPSKTFNRGGNGDNTEDESSDDDDDSVFDFSPVRVRPSTLSSPVRSSPAAAKRRHETRMLFASSPSNKTKSSPMRAREQTPLSSPQAEASATRISLNSYSSTAIWRGSDSSEVSSVSHDDETRAVDSSEEDWMPRRRVGRRKEKGEMSCEMIPLPSSPASVDTVEISLPESSDGHEDSISGVVNDNSWWFRQ